MNFVGWTKEFNILHYVMTILSIPITKYYHTDQDVYRSVQLHCISKLVGEGRVSSESLFTNCRCWDLLFNNVNTGPMVFKILCLVLRAYRCMLFPFHKDRLDGALIAIILKILCSTNIWSFIRIILKVQSPHDWFIDKVDTMNLHRFI